MPYIGFVFHMRRVACEVGAENAGIGDGFEQRLDVGGSARKAENSVT
jgi:hypothetical protein